jgi:hypothetical protein
MAWDEAIERYRPPLIVGSASHTRTRGVSAVAGPNAAYLASHRFVGVSAAHVARPVNVDRPAAFKV